MMESSNNSIFSKKLNEVFKENIKLSYVTKYSVLIFTKNDKCYNIRRSDPKNLLIVSSNNELSIKSIIEDSLVEELSNKKVVDCKAGFWHSIARTEDLKVYYWDLDFEGLFGEERKASGRNKLKPVLIKENVIDIHCGSRHSLALTINGYVYAWGDNQFGQIGDNTKKYQDTPLKLDGFNNNKVKAICCGSEHSLALTERGEVYSWGRNDCGQLGFSNEFSSHSPKLVDLNEPIQMISCCDKYSLLLSCDGDIYVCGWKGLRILGIGDQKILSNPVVLIHSEKFLDIASHSLYSVSAAFSSNSKFYIWGNGEENKIFKPNKPVFESFKDIFEYYLRISYKTTEGKVMKFYDNSIQNNKYENEFTEKVMIGGLGEDKYGELFETSDKYWKTNYAIKKIKVLPQYEKKLLKELKAFALISRMSNEHIIKYFDVWLENEFIFEKGIKTLTENFILHIQMELCHKSLDVIIDEIKSDTNFCVNKTLTPIGYYIASELFIEILEGVEFLHNQSTPIIHRDLHPGNIMLKIEKQTINFVKIKGFQNLKIANFGSATIHEDLNQNENDSKDSGFYEYVAPEELKITKSYTRSDIYSLGIILQNLFVISFDGDYEIRDETQSNSYRMKYRELSNLYDRMTRKLVNKRPVNIDIILKEKHLWSLSAHEFNFKEEFEKVSKSKQSKTSLVFKLLEKKLLLFSKSNSIHSGSRNSNKNYDEDINTTEMIMDESTRGGKTGEMISDPLLLATENSTKKIIRSGSLVFEFENLLVHRNALNDNDFSYPIKKHLFLTPLATAVNYLNELDQTNLVNTTVEIFLKFYEIGLYLKKENNAKIGLQYIFINNDIKIGLKQKSIIDLLEEKSKLLDEFWDIFPKNYIYFAKELDCLKICKIRTGVEFLLDLIDDEASNLFARSLKKTIAIFDKTLRDLTETSYDWLMCEDSDKDIPKEHWWFFTDEF